MENLPDHILVETFKLLDHESLEICSRVCQKWNHVIGTCRKLMMQLKLDLTIQQNVTVDDAFEESKRLRHRRMILRSTEEEVSRANKSKLLDIIQNSCIEDLSLVWVPLSLQNSILTSLPNITRLYIDSLYVHHYYHATIDFPNLKEVDCEGSDFILKSIGQHRIEKLKISFILPEIYKFLETCNGLKELSVWGFLAQYDHAFTNFQLEVLKLSASTRFDIFTQGINWDLGSCRKFLESQKKSLKELHIAYCDEIFSCEEIVIYALNNMDLRVLRAYYPIENGTVHKLNEQLKELKIDFNDDKVTENIIACCPMVERIDLSIGGNFFRRILPLISKHMTHLKHLKISCMFPEEIDEINAKFEKLESLDVVLFHQRDIGLLLKISKCCPNLKYLKVCMPGGAFRWEPQILTNFLALIPNVVEIESIRNFGLNDAAMKLISETPNLQLKFLKCYIGHPDYDYLKDLITEKYTHCGIYFMPLRISLHQENFW